MISESKRKQVLLSYGASIEDIKQLLEYNKNRFVQSIEQISQLPIIPLPDEKFVLTWQKYAQEAEKRILFDVLKKKLIQLQFPIEQGISQQERYREATLKGIFPGDLMQGNGLELTRPDLLQLQIVPTAAGKIPALITRFRPDFIRLVQALTYKNEPVLIPESMGACMVAGYNNWDRIREYRQGWEQSKPGHVMKEDWSDHFRAFIEHKELYQDRFMILTDGPYSAISAELVGISEEDWKEASLILRREHECAHYITRRVFHSMQNNMMDELIADYAGIVAAAGSYRSDWFLRFIGLENYPDYREGGRLQNYKGKPELSDSAFRILQALIVAASKNLEKFHMKARASFIDPVEMIFALCTMTLEELASEEGEQLLKISIRKIGSEERAMDELLEEELERVTGGLFRIHVCMHCGESIAVFGMEICAACFRQQQQ